MVDGFMKMENSVGALIISLDFELMWGMRDICSIEEPCVRNIINARKAVPKILDLFNEYHIAATWATVGFLFAESRDELMMYTPQIKPFYKDSKLNPYIEEVGVDESDDPLHYAPKLIKLIQLQPEQELATHTFSHYYCLEDGQSHQMFSADLDSAIGIAKKYGIQYRSIVFPRNEHNSDYDIYLLEHSILCYRGNRQHAMYQYSSKDQYKFIIKLFRLIDTYINLSGYHILPWKEIYDKTGLYNIRESFFLRPNPRVLQRLNKFRIKRINRAMTEAAIKNQVFHLWWHPHNFGRNIEQSLKDLRMVLNHFQSLHREYGMISLNMRDIMERLKMRD